MRNGLFHFSKNFFFHDFFLSPIFVTVFRPYFLQKLSILSLPEPRGYHQRDLRKILVMIEPLKASEDGFWGGGSGVPRGGFTRFSMY